MTRAKTATAPQGLALLPPPWVFQSQVKKKRLSPKAAALRTALWDAYRNPEWRHRRVTRLLLQLLLLLLLSSAAYHSVLQDKSGLFFVHFFFFLSFYRPSSAVRPTFLPLVIDIFQTSVGQKTVWSSNAGRKSGGGSDQCE